MNRVQDTALYEGCGNRLLIVHMARTYDKNNRDIRMQLQKLGLKQEADSVLVLSGNPSLLHAQGYHVHMDVFEPRGHDPKTHLPGSWSTMCGNGIRAVARYLLDRHAISCLISTGSGIRPTTILPQNNFRVSMGKFTQKEKDLAPYVTHFDFTSLYRNLAGLWVKSIFVGLNGTPDADGIIDGEPHLVLFLARRMGTIEELKAIAAEFGPLFTNNRTYFPQSINTNFVSIKEHTTRSCNVLACTFERGVGYVTQACGTGATVIGSYLLSIHGTTEKVQVQMTGGTLIIERGENDEFTLTGPANRIMIE